MLVTLVLWLNTISNSIAHILLAPIAWLPGWLSASLIASVTGIVMLFVFKQTSNQSALKRTRNQIKANLIALSLFKEELRVCLRVQLTLLAQAGRLLALSAVPILVMAVPMCLALAQLSLWYQARPLACGEQAIVTVHLKPTINESLPEIKLTPTSAVDVTMGPVRVPASNMICWKIEAISRGLHDLTFEWGEQIFTKELAISNSFLPVSRERPSSNPSSMLKYPRERPFAAGSPVQSIQIEYPDRVSWTSGTKSWMAYWFFTSLIAAFVARPLLKVDF